MASSDMLQPQFTANRDDYLLQLQRCIVSPFEVLLERKHGRPFKLINAGDYVTRERVEQVRSKVALTTFTEISDREWQEKTMQSFLKLKALSSSFERAHHADHLIQSLTSELFTQTNNASVLDVILLGYSLFKPENQEGVHQLLTCSVDLFHRNALIAFYAVYFSICSGFYNFDHLRKIYISALLQDIEVTQNGDFYLYEGHRIEIEKRESGLHYLRENKRESFVAKMKGGSQQAETYDPSLLSRLVVHHHNEHVQALSKDEAIISILNDFFKLEVRDFKKGDLLLLREEFNGLDNRLVIQKGLIG